VSFRFLSLLATLTVLLSLACDGQQVGPPPMFGGANKPPVEDQQKAKLVKEMEKRANEQRQAELQRDTEQLYKLASELKQQVGKSSENVLSLDVIKKAEEIERLAHNVREKMKGS
jgi:hypothetical protein